MVNLLPFLSTRLGEKLSRAFLIAVLVAHLLLEGMRWQMAIAYLLAVATVLLSILSLPSPTWLKRLGICTAILLLGLSAVLGSVFQISPIPKPNGAYQVGTFSGYLTDTSRAERFDPSRNRGLEFRIWYPAIVNDADKYEKNTLFSELYSGGSDWISLLFGYMEYIETNSLVHAPVSVEGPFPLILFNHGLYMVVDESPQLMEHLASHGYIVASLTHPFESAKVNRPDGGFDRFAMPTDYPGDVGFTDEEVSDGGIGSTLDQYRGEEFSQIMAALYNYMDRFHDATSNGERSATIQAALNDNKISVLGEVLSAENLESFFRIRQQVRNRSTAYWVEDQQFFLDAISTFEAPVEGFAAAIDLDNVGVMGFSYGGSAAGAFCKVDVRCSAGINLDGTQFGSDWNVSVPAPFLHVYSDTNTYGNAYAYYPAGPDFKDVHLPGTEHQDFIGALAMFPVINLFREEGRLSFQEIAKLKNGLALSFFDEYLRGKSGELESYLREKSSRIRVLYPQQ